MGALRNYLQPNRRTSLLPALGLGRQAAALELETLDVARIHEFALAALAGSRTRAGASKQAERFFIEAIVPIERTHRAARTANINLQRLTRALGRRTADLAAARRCLNQGIAQRKTVEAALKKSAGQSTRLLLESRRLQKQLRRLTHQILSKQEGRRTKISRELHDAVAQTLLGINVRLLTLKQAAVANLTGLQKEIAATQWLVGKSVATMRRFTQEFGQDYEP